MGIQGQGQRQSRRSARKACPHASPTSYVFVPTLAEVLHAITTLYDEELRPFGRILRKRVGELAGGGERIPDVDARCLREICHGSDLIHVEQEEGGDWSALLPGVDATFVDVYCSVDPYPSDFWASMETYLAGLRTDQMFLPGARYSCALVLADRRLPFLLGHSLGQVCHIVQLAISQRKLLGYLNGALVPYQHSLSMLKEQCAMWQQPCAGAEVDTQSMPLASIEVARTGMQEILEVVPGPKPSMMPLSNVKRLFRSRLGVELSETALGFSKLCDMLQSEWFADICTIRLDWNGYVVVQKGPGEGLPGAAVTRATPVEQPSARLCPDVKPKEDTSPSPSSRLQGSVAHTVRNTFIHAPLPSPTANDGARPRSGSVPRDMWSTNRLKSEEPCDDAEESDSMLGA